MLILEGRHDVKGASACLLLQINNDARVILLKRVLIVRRVSMPRDMLLRDSVVSITLGIVQTDPW